MLLLTEKLLEFRQSAIFVGLFSQHLYIEFKVYTILIIFVKKRKKCPQGNVNTSKSNQCNASWILCQDLVAFIFSGDEGDMKIFNFFMWLSPGGGSK